MTSILLLLDFKIEIYFCKIFQMIVYFFQTFDSIGHISKVTVKNGDIYISHHWKVKVTGTSRLQTNTCLQIEFVLVFCCYMVNLVPEILIYVFCYYHAVSTVSLSFFFSQSFSPIRNLGIHTFQRIKKIRIFTHFNLNTFPRVNKCQVENVNSWSPMVILWLSMPR